MSITEDIAAIPVHPIVFTFIIDHFGHIVIAVIILALMLRLRAMGITFREMFKYTACGAAVIIVCKAISGIIAENSFLVALVLFVTIIVIVNNTLKGKE